MQISGVEIWLVILPLKHIKANEDYDHNEIPLAWITYFSRKQLLFI